MKNLLFLVLGIIAISCGTSDHSKVSPPENAVLQTTTTSSVCPSGAAAGTCSTVTTATVGDPSLPGSYTFLDTPDANLCVDAFGRQGVNVPPSATARTLDVNSLRANGIVLSDTGISPNVVMNVMHITSHVSNVVIQLLNKAGMYCIVQDNASYSNVSIQASCSAILTQIEPTIINTVNTPAPSCGFWCGLFGGHGGGIGNGSQNSYSSNITILPCIP